MTAARDFYFGGLNRNRNQTTNVAFRATERVLQEELRRLQVNHLKLLIFIATPVLREKQKHKWLAAYEKSS